jgi:transcriptional accessory protein Tex/SPT6
LLLIKFSIPCISISILTDKTFSFSPRLTAYVIIDAIKDSLKRLIMPSIEREIRSDLTEKAENHASSKSGINTKYLLSFHRWL